MKDETRKHEHEPEKEIMSMGKIYEASALLLLRHFGDAEGDGKKYEMALINGNIPAVTSMETGKTFVLGWENILRMGVEAGLDAGGDKGES